jgi:hypothetical protein
VDIVAVAALMLGLLYLILGDGYAGLKKSKFF